MAKTITEHIELGHPYKEVKKVYSISIVYFGLGWGKDYLYHGQNRFVGVHTGDSLKITTREREALVTCSPEEIFPEYILIRVNEFNQVATSPLEEWMTYLKEGTIRPDTQAPGLEEAREKLRYYSMSEEERRAYEAHLDAIVVQTDVITTAKREGFYEGRMEGRAEGLAEGKKQANIATARKLQSLGVPLEVIQSATGLS